MQALAAAISARCAAGLAAVRIPLGLATIAFDGTRYQVLSLPAKPISQARPPLTSEDDFERDDTATIRRLIRSSLDER